MSVDPKSLYDLPQFKNMIVCDWGDDPNMNEVFQLFMQHKSGVTEGTGLENIHKKHKPHDLKCYLCFIKMNPKQQQENLTWFKTVIFVRHNYL